MWELDHKEGWTQKNWCFQIVVLVKTLESPLNCKIKPVNRKGNQPWICIGRIDAEAETQILWPLMQITNSLEKTLMLGKIKDRRRGWQDEMIGWHHQFSGCEFKQTPGESEGHGNLECCSPWACKQLRQFTEWKTTTKNSSFLFSVSLQHNLWHAYNILNIEKKITKHRSIFFE